MGRPRKKWDQLEAAKVEALAQYGITQLDIAHTLGVNKDVMARVYAAELEAGKAKAHAQIGKRLFEKAMSGDTACLIFWCKTRMGWREKDRPEDAQNAVAGQAGGTDWKQAFRDAINSVG